QKPVSNASKNSPQNSGLLNKSTACTPPPVCQSVTIESAKPNKPPKATPMSNPGLSLSRLKGVGILRLPLNVTYNHTGKPKNKASPTLSSNQTGKVNNAR